jgi:hypothetical protein
MFHVENEVQETLFSCQLWQPTLYNWNFTYYDAKQNIKFENFNLSAKNLHLNHNLQKSTVNPKFHT